MLASQKLRGLLQWILDTHAAGMKEHGRGLTFDDTSRLIPAMMALSNDVEQLERCVVPHLLREVEANRARALTIVIGNVVHLPNLTRPAALPPKGGVA